MKPYPKPTTSPLVDPGIAPRSVLFVAPFGLGQKTTVWARILPLAQQLQRLGMDVSLLIPPWDTPAQAGLAWFDEGVHLANVSLRGGPSMILARLLKRIRNKQPQIVHIVKPVAYAGAVHTLLWWWRKFGGFNARIVLDIDDWEQDWARLNGRSLLVRRAVAIQEHWGISHADGITAASRWLLDEAKRRAPDIPSCYIPNAVTKQRPTEQTPYPTRADLVATSLPVGQNGDAEHRLPRIESMPTLDSPALPNHLNVLFFSRFMEVQAAWLVDFCATLFNASSHATLSVAGSAVAPHVESQFRTDFSQLAHTRNLDVNRVHWLGHIRGDQLEPLYESCACAIFPAEPTRLQQAKCSVRLATTLLHGLPIVASAVGEQAAYGAGGGVEMVEADAPPEVFAAHVVDVLSRTSYYLSRQQANRSRLLETYNWEAFGDKLYQFYATLLAPN